MDLEKLKKTLAALGIASLIAGSALTSTGCSKPEGDSSGSDRSETPAKTSGNGSQTDAGGSGENTKGGSS